MPGRIARTLSAAPPPARVGLAALAGAAAGLAQPPLGLAPALPAAIAALVLILDTTPRGREALAVSFSFAVAYFGLLLYWVAWSFFVVGGPTRFGGPPAVLGLTLLLACFLALPAALAWRLTGPGLGRAVMLAAALALGDWLRGHMFTGFPWALFGYAWSAVPQVEQAAALVGAYGLGLATLLASALLPTGGWRARTAAGLILAAMALYGGARLAAAPEREVAAGHLLRLVQPNIPQREKWRPGNFEPSLARLATLSRGGPRPDAVIWPETAVARTLELDDPLLPALARRAGGRAGLVLGAPVRDAGHAYNSILALSPAGDLAGRHDKAHLVPFGEYLPLRSVLGAVGVPLASRSGFTPGPGLSTLELPGLPPFGALVCYEIIFPGAVAGRDDRPAWLLNLTNDAWYGETIGPHQHFEAARMRAVETGLPVVRVANTGISGAADGYGREIARLGLGETGRLDVRLPPALAPPPYDRWGDAPFLAALVLLALAARALDGRSRRAA